MKDFVNIMGKDNIFIICSIIVVIILALLVIVIIEKASSKKYKLKHQVELPSYKENKISDDSKDNNDIYKSEVINEEDNVNNTVNDVKPIEQEVVYVVNKPTEEDAKKELEEAAKKLVYEEKNDLIGPTFFEKVQEEKSIISYDELLKANLDPDELDNYRVEDEGNEPITLDELYKKNIDDLIEKQEEKINNFNKVQELKEEPKRFKNSSVISPVFGIKSDNEYKKLEAYKSSNVRNIEDEIKKTEEFLSELKKLKERIEK